MKSQYLKNKKGVTLIELIIAIGILSLILMIAFSSNLFGLRVFSRSEVRSNNQFEVRMVTDFIAKQLRFADTIEIITSTPSPTANDGHHYFYMENGSIYYYEDGIGKNVPGSQGVNDFTLSFAKNSDDKLLEFTVGKNEPGYDIQTEVQILNLKQQVSGTNGIGVIFTTDSADAVVIPLSISSIADSSDTASQFSAYAMPLTVVATMSDGSTKNVSVNWNSTIDTSTPGLKTATGNVVGYVNVVNLSVNVIPVTIVSISDINMSADEGQPFMMPSTLDAEMSDGSTQPVAVTWSPSTIDTSTTGTKTALGSVNGYGSDVTLMVNVVESVEPISVSGVSHTVTSNEESGNGSNLVYTVKADVFINLSDGTDYYHGEVTVTMEREGSPPDWPTSQTVNITGVTSSGLSYSEQVTISR